jgi:hypothetical protein
MTGRIVAGVMVLYIIALLAGSNQGKMGMARPGVILVTLAAALAVFFGCLAACGRIL